MIEFLKEIFGSEALTYEQLSEKLEGNENIKLANLASGDYVSKDTLNQVEQAANEKVSAFKLEQAIENAFKDAKVRDAVSVKAHLSMDNVKLNDKGELEGLNDQLEKLKTDNAYLFEPSVKVSFSSPTPGGSPPDIDHDSFVAGIKNAFLGGK